MRRLVLAAAALLAAPSLASAQLTHDPEAYRTFAGCGPDLCAVITLQYILRSGGVSPYFLYYPTIKVRLLQGALTSGATEIVRPILTGNIFDDNYQYATYLGPTYTSLIGHVPGDILQFGPEYNSLFQVSTFAVQSLDGPIRFNAPGFEVGSLATDVFLTETPEPVTLALTLGGLAVLGAGAWRRRRAAV